MNRQKSHQHAVDKPRRAIALDKRTKRAAARKVKRAKRIEAAKAAGKAWKPSPSDINRAMARGKGQQSARKHIPRGDIARAEAATKALPPVKPGFTSEISPAGAVMVAAMVNSI